MRSDEKRRHRKRRLKLVEKYHGEEFSGRPFEIGEENFDNPPRADRENMLLRPYGNWEGPGVSGEAFVDEEWVIPRDYHEQENFMGYAPKNYSRSDERIYEDVCETLTRNPDVDATEIAVWVSHGVVVLSGKVENRRMKKIAGSIIENLPGVEDVKNELFVLRGPGGELRGPDADVRKDLGIR